MKLNSLTILIILLLGSTMFFAPPASAALTLDIARSVSDVRPSETARIEFTVSNTDSSSRNDVVMTMLYPADLNGLSEADFDGDCPSVSCTVGETITWTLGSIPAGGSITFHMAPTVAAAAANGTVIPFVANLTDSSLETTMLETEVVVDSGMNYDVSVSENADPATPGSTLVYDVDYGYRSDAASVSNSLLQFTLPPSATFVSASNGGALVGSTVEWPLGFLSPGDSGSQRVEVQLDGALTAGNVQVASATLSEVSNPVNDLVSQSATSIAATSGIQLSIEINRDQARASEVISYVLTVSNNDPFTRFGIQMESVFPNVLNGLSEAVFDGDCASVSCTTGERLTWVVGDVPSGGTRRFEMPVSLSAAASSGVLINFDVTATDLAGLQTRESEVVRVNNNTLYELLLSDSSEPTLSGSGLTYRADFSYRGDAASVNNTQLVVALPPQVSAVSASDGGVISGSEVTWNLGFLSPGDGGLRTVDVVSDGGLPSATVLSARARIGSLSNTLQYSLAEANTVVSTTPGLQISVETNSNPVRPGDPINYHLVVSNTDPFPRFGVDLTLIYPAQLNGLSEAVFDGDCASVSCTGGEIVSWSLGDIAAGQTVNVDMPATIGASVMTGSLVPVHALVEDDQGTQSFKSETLRIQNDALFELALSDNSNPVVAGAELVYTLKFAYLEDSAAVVQNQLSLELPSAATFVSATDGAVHNDGIVTWNLGFMSPGEGGTRKVKVVVDGAVPSTSLLAAEAKIFVVGNTIETARAELDTQVATSQGLQIAMVSNPDTFRSSELGNYQISVVNRDPFTRFGVDLTGLFPQGIGGVNEVNFDGDCPSVSCTSGELINWELGDIDAGETRTVNFPSAFNAGQSGGSLISFRARVTDDQGVQTRRTASLRVQNDTIFDVSVDSSADPVAAGGQILYRITYGHRQDSGVVTNSMLRLPVPDGATFVSANLGGVLNGNSVEWVLGNLAPGDGGIVEAVVSVDAGAANGSVIETVAELSSNSSAFERATAETSSVVSDNLPLDLNALALTFTTEPGRELSILYSVTNNDAFTRFGVTLYARMPQGFNTLAESLPLFEGDCLSGTSCVAGSRIQWLLGDLPPGATASVLLPPTMLPTAVEGTVIPFNAWVTDQQNAEARAGVSIFTGCLNALDGDCDGVSNDVDNCSISANTAQRDTDGDGFGNVCDPDLNNDLIVNFIDISLFANLFLSSDADADFNGDGAVNFLDYVIMTSFFLSPPGPGADLN